MIDVSEKATTRRVAQAHGKITMAPATLEVLKTGTAKKGDPIPVAKVAAIQAVKLTPQLLPYCHPMPVEGIRVEFEFSPDASEESWAKVIVQVVTIHRTGVEMEALTGVSAALLTLYDMLKSIDTSMVIGQIELQSKIGGKSDGAILSELPFAGAVIVVSDSVSAGQSVDRSGEILEEGLRQFGAIEIARWIVPDEADQIRNAVMQAIHSGADLVLTTGGTGMGPRDVTPEAVTPVFDRHLPGIEEQYRAYSQRMVPTAMLSRMVAGQIGRTLVLCLPGSPGACRDVFPALFPAIKHFLTVRDGGRHGS